jgi:Outer membrane protein beta-barrel domain
MKSIVYSLVAVPALVSVFATTSASAEEMVAEGLFSQQTAAVSNALELGVQFGYSQGVGDVARGRTTVHDTAGAGAAVGVHAGYRLSPQFMIGVYGNGGRYSRGDAIAEGTSVWSATAGVEAQYHFRPSYTVDPWIGLGTGWRGLWLAPDEGKNTSVQGLELARLSFGADYRITPEISITPVLGADMSIYVTENGPGLDGYTNVSHPRVNVGFFAGVGGRFDLFGTTEQSAASVKRNASF